MKEQYCTFLHVAEDRIYQLGLIMCAGNSNRVWGEIDTSLFPVSSPFVGSSVFFLTKWLKHNCVEAQRLKHIRFPEKNMIFTKAALTQCIIFFCKIHSSSEASKVNVSALCIVCDMTHCGKIIADFSIQRLCQFTVTLLSTAGNLLCSQRCGIRLMLCFSCGALLHDKAF